MTILGLPDIEATRQLGHALSQQLRPGDIVAIDGDLGVGKTTLVRAVAESLGVPSDDIGSPSFGLVHEYAAPGVRIMHLDAYRLQGPDDLHSLGWSDWMAQRDCIVLIEWAKRVNPLPERAATVHVMLWHVAHGRDVEVCWKDAQRAAGTSWPASGESP